MNGKKTVDVVAVVVLVAVVVVVVVVTWLLNMPGSGEVSQDGLFRLV